MESRLVTGNPLCRETPDHENWPAIMAAPDGAAFTFRLLAGYSEDGWLRQRVQKGNWLGKSNYRAPLYSESCSRPGWLTFRCCSKAIATYRFLRRGENRSHLRRTARVKSARLSPAVSDLTYA